MEPPERTIEVPPISTTQLRYLTAVLASPSWADAARQLGVTPSALSQGIAELERRLDLSLFERHGRRRVPTAQAPRVVAWAQRLLADTADLIEAVRRDEEPSSAEFRVGMIDTVVMATLAPAVELMHRRWGNRLHLSISTSGELTELVADGRLHAAVIVRSPGRHRHEVRSSEVRHLETRPLTDERLVTIAPIDGAERPSAWLLPPATSATRRYIDEALSTAPSGWRAAEVLMESHNPAVLAHLVGAGFGWSMLPEGAIDVPGFPTGRVTVRSKPAGLRPLDVIWRSGSADHPGLDMLRVPTGVVSP